MKKTILLLLLMFAFQRLMFAQITVTGTVTSSEDGLGLPGAAVVEKGTINGTTTDINGKYKIIVSSESSLLSFSFVGMKSQEIPTYGLTVIDVVLGTDLFKMEEVVVAGVASATPKRKLSVSITKVDSKELEDVPATSAASALQGKVAGVTIVSGSGNPGQSATIRLRGSNSLFEGQSPLILVDGVMFEGVLADINADDISSIEVVKGASASALYGSKAGSGVVVITTKRGKLNEDGVSEIRIRNEYGFSNLANYIKMNTHHAYMLASDYNQPTYTKYAGVTYPTNYQGGVNKDIKGNRSLDYDHYADNLYSFTNDPQNEIFKEGQTYTNYVSLATTGKKTAFFTSFENNYNSGIIWNSKGSSRQNFRINVDHKLTDDFKISTSTLITQNVIDKPGMGGENSPFFSLLSMSPDVNLNLKSPDSLELKDYYYKPDAWGNGENPKHQLYYESSSQKRNDILQNITANWKPANWINFDADYSLEKFNSSTIFTRVKGYQSRSNIGVGSESRSASSYTSQSVKLTSNLQQKIGDLVAKGKLSYIYEKYEDELLYAGGSEMLASGITDLANLKNKASFTIASPTTKTIAKNYSGILDLDYKEKYIASVLYRYDGSSLFGSDNRWNSYYRTSIAYRMNEDFHFKGVQELKIYAAIGTSGQRPGFSYQYETYPIITNEALALDGGIKANKSLKPANTTESVIGINSTFLDIFELEVIRSWANTDGIFFKKSAPAFTGFRYQWANAASTSTNTWEITLGAQLIKTKDFDWNVNLAFDNVTQKVTKSDGNLPPVLGS